MLILKQKNINLVLPGSGTLFPYYAGLYHYLTDFNFKIDKLIGVSGGSGMGAAIASGIKSDELNNILENLDFPKLKDLNLDIFNGFGLIKGDEIHSFLKEILPKNFSDLKIPSVFVTTKIRTQETVYWNYTNSNGIDLPLIIRASMSIPFVFNYVKINNEIHGDGGMKRNNPISFFGNTSKTISFKTLPFQVKEEPRNFGEYSGCIANCLTFDNEENDINSAPKANLITVESQYNNIDFSFNKEIIRNMIRDGYNSAYEYFKRNPFK